jgi:hypothetical protein
MDGEVAIMGTNYYWTEKPPCSCCARPFEKRHIGKSSGGWCFALHVYPGDGIDDLPDWAIRFHIPNSVITNEYGEEVTPDEMLDVIANREGRSDFAGVFTGGYPCRDWQEFHTRNASEPGPKGLLRHKIDSRHCIGHGYGTWDVMVGEFI